MRNINPTNSIAQIPISSVLRIYISDHMGSPAVPIVSVGDTVLAGEMIARKIGKISLDYHSPTSGEVKEIGRCSTWFSSEADYIDIFSDMADNPHSSIIEKNNNESIEQLMEESGVISNYLFPYALKDNMSRFSSLDEKTLIISLMDYGIYSTTFEAILSEYFDILLISIKKMIEFIAPERTIIVLNGKNNGKYMEELKKLNVEFLMVHDLYPVSLPHIILRLVSGEKLYRHDPYLDTPFFFLDVETLLNFGMRIIRGLPMINKIVSVSGYGIARPQVVKCKIGTPVRKLIEQAGGFVGGVGKIILNNVFMGNTIVNLDIPVTKRLTSIVIIPKDSTRNEEVLNCISCGRCVDICPSELEPVFLEKCIDNKNKKLLEKLNIRDCCKCGLCSYVCPSFRTLAEKITIADKLVRE